MDTPKGDPLGLTSDPVFSVVALRLAHTRYVRDLTPARYEHWLNVLDSVLYLGYRDVLHEHRVTFHTVTPPTPELQTKADRFWLELDASEP